MDVLINILPFRESPPDIRIPSLASHSVDDGSFEEFPRRKGFTMQEQDGQLVLELSNDHTYAEYTDLLQSWLFFGFIDTFYRTLGVTIDLRQFIKVPVDGGPEITAADLGKPFLTRHCQWPTAQVKARAKQWTTKLRKLWSPDDRSHGNQIALDPPRDRSPAGNRALCQGADLAHLHVNLFDFADIDASSTSEDRALRSRDRGLVVLSIKYVLYQVLALVYSIRRLPFPKVILDPHNAYIPRSEVKTHRLLCVDDRQKAPPSAGIIQGYLENNGWCPVLARDLLCRQPLSHVYLAAAVIRCDGDFAVHDQCSDNKGCVASNINLDDFEPKHVEQCCCCEPVKPDIGQIYDILQRNEIPIARLSRDRTKRTIMEIVTATSDLNYTVISHVWADGLANAKYNGIFQCQLDKIFECVWRMQIEDRDPQSRLAIHTREGWYFSSVGPPIFSRLLPQAILSKRVAIWVDAICVPVLDLDDLVRSKAMKARAINLMTPTYAGASHVLVLDHRVQQLSTRNYWVKPPTNRELLIYPNTFSIMEDERTWWEYIRDNENHLGTVIRNSSWMSRCWTLQESALARTLYFQCSDSAICAPCGLLSDVDPQGTQELMEALLSRSTSMTADMDQIFANLSRLDASELTQYSSSDRVKAFLKARGNPLPIGLLLRHLEQAPDQPRDEWWIPDLQSRASFYSSGWQSSDVATLCDRGALIRCRRKSFWQEEECEIQPYSVQPAGATNKTFWIDKEGKMFWIVLDLEIDCFSEPATTSAGPDLVLLLPGKSSCQNARGFIGRGLCLTRTRSEQTHITVCGSEDTIKAWPTLYNCALSIGVETPLSAIEYAQAPVFGHGTIYTASEEDRDFIIETDTSSWPQIHTVRGVKAGWYKAAKLQAAFTLLPAVLIIVFGILLLIVAGAIYVTVYLQYHYRKRKEKGAAMIITLMIGFLSCVIFLASIVVIRGRRVRRRQKAFEEWVQSFSPNSQQQSSNVQPQA